MSSSALPTPPQHFFDRIGVRDVSERVAFAMREGTAFSLVRLGDGEGRMLCWPGYQAPNEIANVSNTWFGRSDLPKRDLDMMADGLRRAVRSADVLGVPTRSRLSRFPVLRMVFDGIDRYNLYVPSQPLADAGMHWFLQWSGALAYLLRHRDCIGVIGCRDIGPQIAEAFCLGSVRTYLVRGESAYPGAISKPHWPDGYNEVMGQLESIRPGSVFLVGAGLLGKIYCDKIKSKGGIAIDIGSILDSWANVPSRVILDKNGSPTFTNTSAAFTLDYCKSVGDDWEQMAASLKSCAAELIPADTTITL